MRMPTWSTNGEHGSITWASVHTWGRVIMNGFNTFNIKHNSSGQNTHCLRLRHPCLARRLTVIIYYDKD